MIINSSSLCETLSDQTGFIALNRTVSLAFDVIHPFTTDRAFARRQRNEAPCLIVNESLKLRVHSFLPLRITHSKVIRRRFLITTNICNITEM